MADIRIKDLTTTASSTASDDFFAADGTTNGTRKLSAYSPSFGGNATVGGTLTVNGTGSSTFGTTTGFSVSTGITVPSGGVGVGAVGTGGSFYVNTPSLSSSYGSGLAVDGSYPGGVGAQSVVNIKAFGVMSGGGYGSTLSFHTTLSGTFNEVMRLTSGSVVQVLGTTASTSTSSGALVVGNGTSGGLGVGGAIWGGGKVHVGSAGYLDGGAKLNVYATPSDAGYLYGIRLSDNATATLALGLQTPTGTTSSFIHSNIALGFGTVGVAALNINTSQQVQVLTSTASTSTSSGALVVSGGVGVAGNTNIGGALRFHTNTALPGTASISKDATFGLNFYASTGSSYDFTIFNAAGTGLLVNPTGTSALTAFDTFTATGTLIANAASNAFRITTAQTPASASATGTAGTICWDTSYIYVCTATNTWKRVAIATW